MATSRATTTRPSARASGSEDEAFALKGRTPKKQVGDRAERAAADFLERAGYLVVAANLRVGRLEIDLVAREGRVVAVVEVRSRGPGSWVRALDSVDAKKRERIRRAGTRLWQERFTHDPTVDRMRFDIIAVDFTDDEPRFEHIRAAF